MIGNSFPITLGIWPTPLANLPTLSRELGIHLDIKRDDLSGLALGGNKTRKLEPILSEAISQGCDTVITAGAAQSNHCRQTAAAAASLSLECHLVLGSEQPDFSKEHLRHQLQGNLLLDVLFGSHLHWAGDNRKGEDLDRLRQQLIESGKKPYTVPYGGSNPLGATAYVNAVAELAEQTKDEKPYDKIIVASSSGGTQAGLILGNLLYQQFASIIGIAIDKEDQAVNYATYIASLANETATLIGSDKSITDSQIEINSDYLGAGYGVVTQAERNAIALMAQKEGILLDPVYSGRAFAGLLGMLEKGEISKNQRILFWHTGGAPALFAYSQEFKLNAYL